MAKMAADAAGFSVALASVVSATRWFSSSGLLHNAILKSAQKAKRKRKAVKSLAASTGNNCDKLNLLNKF